MRLGTRWSVGEEPPASVPPALRDAIRSVEDSLEPADAASLRWTLSWLENRPSAELDDGTLLEVTVDGTILRTD